MKSEENPSAAAPFIHDTANNALGLVCYLDVVVDVPLQALPADMALTDGVDYVWRGTGDETPPARGSVVLVVWARRRCLGVVLGILATPRYDATKVLPAVLLPALAAYRLPETVLKLAHFASQYYHRGMGEVLLPTISAALPAPKKPRTIPPKGLAKDWH